MRNPSSTLFLFLVILSLAACGRKDHETKPKVSRAHTIESLIFVHAGAKTVLEVGGRKFEGVRGRRPCYLEVPQIDGILFVTDEPDYSIKYHVVLPKSKTFIEIPAGSTAFGRDIGYSDGGDKIERVDGNVVVLRNENRNASSHRITYYFLDLQKKERVREVTYFPGPGGETNRIYEKPLSSVQGN